MFMCSRPCSLQKVLLSLSFWGRFRSTKDLEAIAEIHNCTHRLKKWELSKEDIRAEEIAEEVNLEKQARGTNFAFSECKIPIGAVLEHVGNPSITCIVVDERRIEYNGETMYITPFAKLISGKNYITKGPKYLVEHFKYNGELLKDICDKTEN